MANGGILIRDVFAHILFFPIVFGSAFIPWSRTTNERPFSLDWYSRLFDKEEWLELEVKGFEFSKILRKGMRECPLGRKPQSGNEGEGEGYAQDWGRERWDSD